MISNYVSGEDYLLLFAFITFVFIKAELHPKALSH